MASRIKQDLDLTGVSCRAMNRQDNRVAVEAINQLFPREIFDKEQLTLDYHDGKCPFASDVTIRYKGKVLMKRIATARTGFHYRYESPIFDNPKSK